MSRNARELVALAAIAASAATSCLLIYPLSERTDASHAPPLGSGGAGVETPDTGSTSDASDVGDAATEDDAPASCSLRACRANSKYLEQPVVCQPGCVPAGEDDCCRLLRTNECPFVYPKDAWRNENAVYFGAYAAIESRDFEGRSSPVVNYKLALDELFAARSIPDADNRQHPFVAIICNNDVTTAANDPMFYRKSIAHLVGDVGVPAVVADLPPNVIAPAFAQTREMGKKVFFLSPGAANRDVRAIDDDGGLIWTLSGQPKDLAPGYQALIGRIERYIQA
ncbi:MAG TPA: hypothetical protein VJT73_20345, partial [Polyangiaceae bacterium]|nr:hypothetical protein [Polyangiaceae bacterium]